MADEYGRVEVGIWPNFDQFAAELQRGLQAQVRDAKVQVGVVAGDADLAQARRRVETTLGQAGAAGGKGAAAGFSNELQKVVAGAKRIGDAAAQNISQALTVGVGAGVGALTASVFQGIQYNILGQQTAAAFTTMLGTRDAAREMMSELSDFATQSPFPRQAFIAGTQQLLGFKVEAESIIPIFGAIEDAVAATGGSAYDLSSLITIFAQIKSAGRLMGQDLMQLSSRGIDALQLMADQAGVTKEEMKELTQSGAMDGQEIVEQLASAMEATYGGAAEGVKATMVGALDRVKGASRDLGSALVEPFVSFEGGGAAVSGVNAIADVIRRVLGELKDGGVLEPLMVGLERFADLADVAGDRLREMFRATEPGQPVAEGVQLIKDLVGTASQIAPTLTAAGTAFGLLAGGNIPFVGELVAKLPTAQLAVAAFALSIPEVRTALFDLGKAVAPLVVTLADRLVPIIDDLEEVLGSAAATGIEAFGVALQAALVVAVPLADALGLVTGFVAENAGIVEIAVGAWIAYKTAVIASTAATTTWGAVAAAVIPSTAVSLNATTAAAGRTAVGFRAMAASASLAMPAIAAIGAAAVVSYKMIEQWSDEGARRGAELADKITGANDELLQSRDDYVKAMEDMKWAVGDLREDADNSINPLDAAKRAQLRAGADAIVGDYNRLDDQLRVVDDAAVAVGLSWDETFRLMGELNLDPAVTSTQEAVVAIEKHLDELEAAAAAAGVSVGLATTLGPDQLKAIEETAGAMEAALGQIQNPFSRIVDESVDPEALASAEEAVREAERRLNEIAADDAESRRSAMKAVDDARRELAQLRDSDDPLNAAKIQRGFQDMIAETRTWSKQISDAFALGYDPSFIVSAIQAGPTEAGPILAQLTGDAAWTMVEMVNGAQAELSRLNTFAVEQARLTQMAIEADSQQMVMDLEKASVISAAIMQSNGQIAIEELAELAGTTTEEVKRIAEDYGLQIEGMKETTAELEGIWARVAELAAIEPATVDYLQNDQTGWSALMLTPEYLENLKRVRGERWGGIHEYALGGLHVTPAHIAIGERIKYAEPQTGGEAFIPKIGELARQEAITRVVAEDWLGGLFITAKDLSKRVTSFADGGIGLFGGSDTRSLNRLQGAPVDQSIHIGQIVTSGASPKRDALAIAREARRARWMQGP